jgi:hypothetical protein
VQEKQTKQQDNSNKDKTGNILKTISLWYLRWSRCKENTTASTELNGHRLSGATTRRDGQQPAALIPTM